MTDTPFEDYFRSLYRLCDDPSTLRYLNASSLQVADLIIQSHLSNKIIALCGNGGSAADAQHWSAELMCRYELANRPPLRSVSLTTDTSFITACSNDFNFSSIFSRQLLALHPTVGVIIALSTSGQSPNIRSALATASELSITSVLLTGSSSLQPPFVDHLISFPTSNTALIQTYSQIFYHVVCSLVDQYFSEHG